MKLNDYVKWTASTCARLDTILMDSLHMILGMGTEIGELQDVFKKHIAYKKDIDWVNVSEEVGDVMYYVASFCRLNNLDLEKIIERNVEKLESRYPNNFSTESALDRNLTKEREILEK